MNADSIDAGPGRAWRAQATVKLVGRRRKAVMRLALREAPGCSPVEAIDRAIDLAFAGRNGDITAESRLDAIEDTLEAMDHQRRAEAAKALAAIETLSASVSRLHSLIASVATDYDPE